MSLAATIWARQQRIGNGIAKAVLVALAEHANKQNTAWPSQLTLSEETDFSVRAVRNAMKLLEARGYIRRRRRLSVQRGQIPDLVTLPVGETVGAKIYRHDTPENADLPAPQVDLPAPRADEPIKNLYPIQEGSYPPSQEVALGRASPTWDDYCPFGRGASS